MENTNINDILSEAENIRNQKNLKIHEIITSEIYSEAEKITNKVTSTGNKSNFNFTSKLDYYLTNKWTGFPIMFAILAIVFWLTIAGANVPSAMLASLLVDTLHPILGDFMLSIGSPWWLKGFLIDGVYLALAWVVSVMLPPMAIFFPIFTILEDFGYLPRVAFNLDPLFRKSGAHGKQALSMAMGYGCNAAGIIATRIIDSPRERLIAIITNNFSLCNGRWPTQILIATIFIGSLAPVGFAGLYAAGAVVGVTLFGVILTFLVSYSLSKTVLKGESSSFSLELPPYRPPRILKTLYTSLIDRTLFVLWRALLFAAPSGALIWLTSNITVNDVSLAVHTIDFLDPFAIFVGLNGVILLAYIIAIPANEIIIPTVLMLTVLKAGMTSMGAGTGVMFEFDDLDAYRKVFEAGGWTVLTGINLMLFSLLHNPCSTTIYTIYKETKSKKWTAVATLLPVFLGFLVCFVVAQIWYLF